MTAVTEAFIRRMWAEGVPVPKIAQYLALPTTTVQGRVQMLKLPKRTGGPWCSRCGDNFSAPAQRDCPNPKPGVPLVDCGRGGHVFDVKEFSQLANQTQSET